MLFGFSPVPIPKYRGLVFPISVRIQLAGWALTGSFRWWCFPSSQSLQTIL